MERGKAMVKMLVIDDNKQITSILEDYAKKEGYQVITAFDGQDALEKFQHEQPDIALLDVMMPKKDGFEVCKEIRRVSTMPVIMITARGEDFEKIMGLDIGADDYIVKPFSPSEVMARVRAILRRVKNNDQLPETISFDSLMINMADYSVTINQNSIPLTKKEVEILWTLASHQNKVFTRENLLDSLWGIDYFGDSRTVDTHIKRLRSKLAIYDHKHWDIKTIWGIGYKFEVLGDV